ncbi:hypothetical protein GCM10007159_01420 [Modicisalibacter luteus]|nr:hypothetical protein GCM10007159_01420 [Halomonas lutea]
MVRSAIEMRLDPGFDLTKVEKHAVFAQLPVKLDAHMPTGPDQAAVRTPQRDIQMGQVINEESH